LADVNAEIGVSIDTSGALSQLKALQREIARFHTSVAKSSESAALAQRDLQRNFVNGVNAISGFSAELRTVKTTAESFTDSLEKNKFSMREYFRYSVASTKTFGKTFRTEFDTINKVALENVKRLQTQYIKMGRDANGAMKAIAIMPTKLNLEDFGTQTQITAQKQALFNQLVRQGSTNLLNFGKNTQWAGRQLMVGFTLPLVALGSAASKTFMDMESAAIKFKKVYGDLFTAPEETQKALDSIKMLGREFTKYGVAVSKTLDLAADAAAAGYEGAALTAQVTQATRLQVLGQIDQQKALEATIALQNAFKISSNDLAASVNFLNAVENQTVLSLDDIAQAVPRVGPIITELGGDIKDLAFFLTAMKEGGVGAAQGANALKSGLGRLINPTKAATEYLSNFGINLTGIVEKNAGDLRATVMEFANAIQPLDDLSKARAVEKVFGKFQFARTLALLNNITRDGTQAARVLDLASASTEDLAALAESELGITAESAMNKFKAAAENLKASLAPIGELFLEIITPFLQNIGKLLDKFNNLSAGTKKIITALVIGIGAIAPVVLMTVGLFANFVANGIKGLMLLRGGYLKLTGQSKILSEQTNYLSVEQQQALAAAASLEQSHMKLQQVFTGEAAAVRALVAEYQRMIAAQNTAAIRFPTMMQPGFKPQGYAEGVVSVPGLKGAGDIIPAMLSPGEAVIPAKMTEKYSGLINAMIADKIPGFKDGTTGKISTRFTFFTKEMRDQIASQFSLGESERLRIPLTQGGSAYSVAGIMAPREVNRPTGPRVPGMASGMTQEYLQSPMGSASFMANVQVGLEKLGVNSQELSVILDTVAPILKQAIDSFDGSVESWVAAANNATQSINDLDQLTEQQKEVIRQRVAPVDPDDYLVSSFPMMEVSAKKAVPRNERNKSKYGADRQSEILREQGFDTSGLEYSHMPGFEKIPAETSVIGAPTIAGRKLTEQQVADAQEIAAKYEDAKQAHKKGLLELQAEIDKAEGPIKESSKRVGKSSVDGIAQGASEASPIKQGENVVDKFEQGMLQGMDDAAFAGSKVGSAAVKGLSQPAIPGLVGQGIVPGASSPLPKVTAGLQEFQVATAQASDITNKTSVNISKWNRRLMSGSFMFSSVTGALSLFGKDLGKNQERIFKLSSAMFILQGVIQAVTQAELLRLATTRAGNIAALMGAKNFTSLFVKGGGFASLGKNLATFGKFATRFLGLSNPIGWVVTGLVVLGGGIYKYNKMQEEARKKIEGLGEAASATGKKMEGLADYFGISEKKFPTETYNFEAAGSGILPTQQASEVEKITQSEMFKNLEDTVEAIKNATRKEATLALQSLSTGLEAKGYAKNQIETIIQAILQEAGRNDIVLDFNSLDISSKEGKQLFDKTLNDTFNTFNKRLAKGVNESFDKSLTLTGNVIANAFNSLRIKLADGTITATEYAEAINNINSKILGIKDSVEQANLVDSVFKAMGPEAQKAASGISDLSDRLLVMQAVLMNINSEWIKVLGDPQSDAILRDIARRAIYKDIEVAETNLETLLDLIKKRSGGGDTKGLTIQEKLVKIYQRQIKELEKKAKALKAVNDQISRQNEFIQNQMDLQTQITEAKISGNYLEAAALSQQKLMEQSEYNRESREIELQKRIDKIQERIDQLEDKGKSAKLTQQERRLLKFYEGMFKGDGGKSPDPTKKTDNPKTATQDTTTPPKYKFGKPKDADIRFIPDPPENLVRAKSYSQKLIFDKRSGRWLLADKESFPSNTVSYEDWSSGTVRRYNPGGKVSGPGTGTSDSIPAYLSNGEYVIKEKTVSEYGVPFFDALNAQKFKDGGGVGKLLKGSGKVGAAAGLWQTMEELEKMLSLKYGANENALGLEKWSKAFGRFAFNTAQGGVTGLSFGGTGGLFGVGEGLVEGLIGLAKDGSQYGVKGGSRSTEKGFNAKKELESMSLKNSLLSVLSTAGIGTGMGFSGNLFAPYIKKIAKPFVDKIKKPSASPRLLKSAFQKEDLELDDAIYSVYQIGNNKEKIIFQGRNENISESIGALGVRKVPTTPTGLITEALRQNPKNKSLKSMLDNFKNEKFGDKERDFLARIVAATGMDSSGTPLTYENTDGFAEIISYLSGNKASKKTLDLKTKSFYGLVEKNKLETAKNASKINPNLKDVIPINLDNSPIFHATKHPVVRNADGSVDIKPAGAFDIGEGIGRSTVHTSAESGVIGHLDRQGGSTYTQIVSKYSSMIDRNGLPINGSPTDTYWSLAPGRALNFPDAAIIRHFTDEAEYRKELLKRGLISKKDSTPVLITDKNSKEVLRLEKGLYTEKDILDIIKLEKPSLSFEGFSQKQIDEYIQGMAGRESKATQQAAQQEAKKLLNINTKYTDQDIWSLVDENLQERYIKFNELSKIPLKIHNGSPLSSMEIAALSESKNLMPTFSKVNTDSIEAAMYAALQGQFKTNIKEKTFGTVPRVLAQGGYVSMQNKKPKPKKLKPHLFTPPGVEDLKGMTLPRNLNFDWINKKRKDMITALPKFEMGIDNVPYDMPALLHQGERVLTKDENKKYNQNSSVVNATFNITGDNPKDIANQVMIQLERINNKNNKSNRVML
jgi:TP901 family phage tail tape measure protein